MRHVSPSACRLESFGFEEVYDYVAGIADWSAAGLPLEGDGPVPLRVADALRTDLPTSRPDESVDVARERTLAAGWDDCAVIDCGSKVIGRVRREGWEADPSTPVSEVMEIGPTTVRPDAPLEALYERMERRGTTAVLVTTPEGDLLGAVLRSEAASVVSGPPLHRVWVDCEGCPGRWSVR